MSDKTRSKIATWFERKPLFYLVYTDNLTPSSRRTLQLGNYVSPSMLDSNLFLDVILVNQESIDPNFTSIKDTFFETVSGYPDGHGHCYSGNSQFTCCRVFNPSGYRCQSIGHPYALTDLDRRHRLDPSQHKTTIFSYVYATEKTEASSSKQIIRTDAILGDQIFSEDRSIFYLCEEHCDMFRHYFSNQDLTYNELAITLPAMANLAFGAVNESIYRVAVDSLATLALSLDSFVESMKDPKALAETIISNIPSDQLWRILPISHDAIIAPLNRLYRELPYDLRTNQKLTRFYNFVNGFRIVDAAMIDGKLSLLRPIKNQIQIALEELEYKSHDFSWPSPSNSDSEASPRPSDSDSEASPRPSDSDSKASPRPSDSDSEVPPRLSDSDSKASPRPSDSDSEVSPRPSPGSSPKRVIYPIRRYTYRPSRLSPGWETPIRQPSPYIRPIPMWSKGISPSPSLISSLESSPASSRSASPASSRSGSLISSLENSPASSRSASPTSSRSGSLISSLENSPASSRSASPTSSRSRSISPTSSRSGSLISSLESSPASSRSSSPKSYTNHFDRYSPRKYF